MKPKNKKYAFKDSDMYDNYFDINKIASATECTGLIPTPPSSESEAESYTNLYDIPQPENEKDLELQQERPN